MPTHRIGFDHDGNPIPDTGQGMEIFEKGNIILVVSELEGDLSVQILGEPSERILTIIHHVYKTYKKLLRKLN